MNLIVIFLTGLTLGGLSCLTVQGGLLASIIVADEEKHPKYSLYATLSFLIAKLVSHSILGIILGAFGSSINLNDQVQTSMQLLAGVYMILVALNLLDVHPIFRYVVIQPPKFLTRLIKNQTKSKNIFAPALFGLMTVFIPCGTTLAMETLAISSANAWQGGAIMAAFILGTTPLFLAAGLLTSFLGETLRTKFFKFAALILIYLGIVSVNGALVALGSPISISAFFNRFSTNEAQAVQVSQDITIEITDKGYSPSYLKVKKNAQVNLKIINQDVYSCAAAFRIPSLGISVNVNPNQEKIISFTPTKAGKIPFSCSMGMYRGIIEVL